MPTTDDFRAALRRRFDAAANSGATSVDINAGELGKALRVYPQGGRNRLPSLCRVLRAERQADDAVVSENTGDSYVGPRLTIRYRLPRRLAAG